LRDNQDLLTSPGSRQEGAGNFRLFPWRFRCGDCVLDSDTRELRVRGKAVHISPKGFELLEALIRSKPRALSKEEIHKRLWRNTFVSDGTLTSLLAEVRSAIGDTRGKSRWIRTVHRFGYAFSGLAEPEVRSLPGRPRVLFVYRLFWGAREIALQEGENLLGRDPLAGILIDHTSVSRRHACMVISHDNVTIEDLGSKNGTCVRGRKIEASTSLSDGDEIRIGSLPMTFRSFPLSESTETVSER
jgi:hypothetical protein